MMVIMISDGSDNYHHDKQAPTAFLCTSIFI